MKSLLVAILIAFSLSPGNQAFANDSIKEIRVFKSEHRLELVDKNDQIIKAYKVRLGKNPEGAKKESGDNKTPEGVYVLDWKVTDSKFHKAFHISYPNMRDKIKASLRGKNPGGDIMLHGYPEDLSEMKEWLKVVNLDGKSDNVILSQLGNYDWTDGCIAVTDDEIDEIFSMVNVPMKIIINP